MILYGFPAKVERTFRGDNPPYTIDVKPLVSGQFGVDRILTNVLPLDISNVKMPLEGEVVWIQRSPASGTSIIAPRETFYFTETVSTQAKLLSNLESNSTETTDRSSGNVSIRDSQNGITQPPRTTTAWKPSNNILDSRSTSVLQPFDGDSLLQSRFGSTIRLSQTLPIAPATGAGYSQLPTWEKGVSNNSGPIMIISNTYRNNSGFRVENINTEDSSIWLTTGQNVGLDLAAWPLFKGSHYETESNSHILDFDEVSPSILINSDRVIINSKARDITISARQSLNIGASEGVSIRAWGPVELDGRVVLLGKSSKQHKLKKEPVVKGESFAQTFDRVSQLLDQIITLVDPKNSTGLHEELREIKEGFRNAVLSKKVFTE